MTKNNNRFSSKDIAAFALAKKLFQMRRTSGRMKFDEGYAGCKHKELVKVEEPEGLTIQAGQTARLFNPSSGEFTDLKPGNMVKKGEIFVIDIPKGQQNKRSKVNGVTDSKNIRIRFVEHVPPQILGTTTITGAILNTHGVNSNLSISSERRKYSDVLRHNITHPHEQKIFVSYDPPGYGLSGDAKMSMAQNEGHRLEEITIGSMNLMALYTSAISKEKSGQDIGLSIHAHSRSTGEATELVSKIFSPEADQKLCGIPIPKKDQIKINSLLLEAPYTSFQQVVKDTSKGIFKKWLYNKLHLPQLNTVESARSLAQNAPEGFKLNIIQHRATGGELSALVGPGDGIMKHDYAYKIAAAAVNGFQNNNTKNVKRNGAVNLITVENTTHHGKTAQRFGKTNIDEVGEEIFSHSKLKELTSNIAKFLTGSQLRHANKRPELELSEPLKYNQEYSEICEAFNKEESQDHKYTSVYLSGLKQKVESQNILNVVSHEEEMLKHVGTAKAEDSSTKYRDKKQNIIDLMKYWIKKDSVDNIKGPSVKGLSVKEESQSR
jgi:hypothetical protein